MKLKMRNIALFVTVLYSTLLNLNEIHRKLKDIINNLIKKTNRNKIKNISYRRIKNKN